MEGVSEIGAYFMNFGIVGVLDGLLGLLSRTSGRVQVGRGTRVAWRHLLRVQRGNQLVIGNQTIFGARVSFEDAAGRIVIGDRTYIGRSHLVCHSRIAIGSDVIISWGVTIVDHDSHATSWAGRANDVLDWAKGIKNWEHVKSSPVVIEDKVWIGFNTIILKGVTVGAGSVIGAGSVVAKDVPAYSVAAGNPARVIRELSEDEREHDICKLGGRRTVAQEPAGPTKARV
jgi:acetyltransferase-like isoleucine patch superfamily enzyme